MLCSVNECGRVVLTRGLCSGHFARLTKTGDIRESVPIREFTKTVEQRFWEKVERNNTAESCWLWTAGTCGNGRVPPRGLFYVSRQRSHVIAPRMSWELTHGRIPDGLCVLHNCPSGDNPLCVRPDHLWLGTKLDNINDMYAKGRGNPHPPVGSAHHGAKLTEDAVAYIRATYRSGGVTHKELAKTFGVTESMIGKVVRGKFWTHVAESSELVSAFVPAGWVKP